MPCTSLFAISRYASCLHGCLGFGPFLLATAFLAYLIAGFFIGPFGMVWVKSQESISPISELDLTFTLFMIVLYIDLKKSRIMLFAAGGQLALGSVLGMLVLSGHPADQSSGPETLRRERGSRTTAQAARVTARWTAGF